MLVVFGLFFFNDTATTEIYTLSLHDALPIWLRLAGRTVFGTKPMVLNGRRGPMGPGPGGALFIRCARCRCTPCEPRYPSSSAVTRSRLFSAERLHCSMYCDGACGSMAVKLTVVSPSTGCPKLKPDEIREADGVKL